MRIVHVSDIHIRNLKYHASYRNAFEDLYRHLEELKPDIIINTGDTAHTKCQISPEFVEMCSEHIRKVAEFAPYHILLGNHDLNLVNLHRQDAITPIVDSINSRNVVLHKKSGHHTLEHMHGPRLQIFSCADEENFPNENDYNPYDINIGLYHGSVRSAVTDSNWELKDTDTDLSLFKGLDFVLLGDIHKHQFLDKEKRIAYAGSLIQQNFGEDPDKGFLVWDIHGKDIWEVRHIELKGSRKFFTVRLGDNFEVPDVDVDPGSRVRIVTKEPFTLVDQQAFERKVKDRFNPHDVISIPPQNISRRIASSITGKDVKVSNLRNTNVQEDLVVQFFEGKKIPQEVFDKMWELNSKYQVAIDKESDIARDVFWKMKTLVWSNMFNYGEDNVIDFSKLQGITGIFAPNSAGKSSLIDIIVETLYDKVTKPINKNIFLVNDNKQIGKMIAQIAVGDEDFLIERTIEKVKYGQKKLDKAKEWGKTGLEFKLVNEDGDELDSLNGQLRPETERNIRKKMGTYDDFVLTTLLSQDRDTDIIKCKDTDRKKILYKFMDLDIFEQKGRLAKDESKEHLARLKGMEEGNLVSILKTSEIELEVMTEKICDLKEEKIAAERSANDLTESLRDLLAQKQSISMFLNKTKIENDKNVAKKKWLETKEAFNTLTITHQRDRGTLSGLISQIEAVNLPELTDSLEAAYRLTEEYDSLSTQLAEEQKIVKRWDNEVKILGEVPCGDKFPTCKFLVNAFDKKKKLEDQKVKVAALLDIVTDVNEKVTITDIPSLKFKMKAYRGLITDEKVLKNRLVSNGPKFEVLELKMKSSFEAALRSDKEMISYLEAVDTMIKNEEIETDAKDVNKVLDVNKKKIQKLQDEILNNMKELGSKEMIVKHLTEELEDMKELRILCDAYEYYGEAMGKYGIAYQILVEKLPLINDEINKILSSVAEFSVFIEHDPEEQSLRLYLQYGDYKGRRLELAGGAEKLLASIAIRTALLSITNLPKTNMFIIDEGFGSLDPSNLDNINRMFDYLRSVFDHVLVISHIDALKDMVDNNIEISSDDEGYSHIEVC